MLFAITVVKWLNIHIYKSNTHSRFLELQPLQFCPPFPLKDIILRRNHVKNFHSLDFYSLFHLSFVLFCCTAWDKRLISKKRVMPNSNCTSVPAHDRDLELCARWADSHFCHFTIALQRDRNQLSSEHTKTHLTGGSLSSFRHFLGYSGKQKRRRKGFLGEESNQLRHSIMREHATSFTMSNILQSAHQSGTVMPPSHLK